MSRSVVFTSRRWTMRQRGFGTNILPGSYMIRCVLWNSWRLILVL